jgi:hypothetical protein
LYALRLRHLRAGDADDLHAAGVKGSARLGQQHELYRHRLRQPLRPDNRRISGVSRAAGYRSEVFGYETMYRLMLLPIASALAVFVLNRKKLMADIKRRLDAAENDPA